jgi:hypothetical protein
LVFADGVSSLKALWDAPCPSPTGEPFRPRGGVVPTPSAGAALGALWLGVVSIQWSFGMTRATTKQTVALLTAAHDVGVGDRQSAMTTLPPVTSTMRSPARKSAREMVRVALANGTRVVVPVAMAVKLASSGTMSR